MQETLTNADSEVLSEIYRNAKHATEAIYSMISRIEDEELALDLNRQAYGYINLSDRAQEALFAAGQYPQEHDISHLFLHLTLLGKSLRDQSASHIAALVIAENRRDLARTRRILRENADACAFACEMADELVALEECSITRLRDYM